MENVGLSCESNWDEAEGCLESCVIFKPGIPQGEGKKPIMAHGLVRLTASQGPGPCQITFKFRQRPCKVHSIYVQSTAEVYEIYSRLELNGDNEYVCTIHGEVTTRTDDFKYVEGSASRSEICPLSWASSMDKPSESSGSSTGKVGTDLLQKEEKHYREMADGQNLVGILEKNKDGTHQNMSQRDSIHFPEEITKNESNSSEEDSWVEVKIPGFLVEDPPCKAGDTCRFRASNDKKDMEGTVEQQLGIPIEDDCRKIKDPADKNGYKSIPIKDRCTHVTEEKIATVITCGSSEAKARDAKAAEDNTSIPLCGNNSRHEKIFYEATIEMVNAKPCMSLTIQLLSFQDKCSVEIEEMHVYAIPATEIMGGMQLMDLSSCSVPLGSSVGPPLLAMLVPSILQISRDGLNQRQDVLFSNPFNGRKEREWSECGSSLSESSSITSQQLINRLALMEDLGTSAGQFLSPVRFPGKRFSTELLLCQKKLSHSLSSSDSCLDEIGENVEVSEDSLRNIVESILSSECKIDELCGKEQQGGIGNECSELGQEAQAVEELACRMAEPEVKKSVVGCNIREVELAKTNEIDEGLPEVIHGDTVWGHLVQRVDKLEDLCMQIEVKVLKALGDMERRIQLLESQQTLPKQSFSTAMDGSIQFSGLYSLTNFSSSTCSPGIVANKCRQDSVLEASSKSSSEVSLSVSIPNISSVSFPNCSPAIVTSSSSIPSTNGLHLVQHPCLINSMDYAPHDAHALVKKSSKPDLHESSLDVFLHESTSNGLDMTDSSKESEASIQNFSSKGSNGVECTTEGRATGSGGSVTFCESPTTTKRPQISIDEALALALSAFSASIGPSHEEKACIHMQAPYNSSEVENTDDEEVCYHDDLVFDSSEEMRYRSQESMDSVPFSSSSQDSQDARYSVSRRYKIGVDKAGDSVHNKQACKPDIEKVIKFHKEVMPLEGKTESRMLNSGMVMPKMKHEPRHASPKMTAYGQECNMLHCCQEQDRLLDECVSSKCCLEDNNLTTETNHTSVVDGSSLFDPVNKVSGKFGSELSSIKGILSNSKVEGMQAAMTLESADSRQLHDDAMTKLNISSSSFLDITFTTHDTYQAGMSLEALLCDHTPGQDGKTAGFLECTNSKCPVNAPTPKRTPLLFFVEDEELGDFIIPSPSTLPCSVSAGNFSVHQGILPGMSPGFESLL